MYGPFVTGCTCVGTSPDPFFSLFFLSLSFSLSVSVSVYITGNLHVYEQVRSAQSGCNSGIENYYDDVYFIFSFVCIQFLVSLGSYLCLCLFLNVSNGVRLYYDSLYVHTLLCTVFVCLFRTEYLY